MKRIVTGLCSAILLSTSSYAGGDTKKISPAQEPYLKIPMTIEDKNFYVGLGVSAAQVNSHVYDKETLLDVSAKVGYNLSKYLAIEFRGSIGVNDGDKLGHEYSSGIYLKPQYPVDDDLTLYALLGYAQSKITFENEEAFNGVRNNYTTQNGFSFGLGLDYKLSEDWSLFVDAIRYIDESTTRLEGKYGIKVDAITFGVSYHF